MTSNRKERLALVTKRLEDELVQQNDFFHSCCELALGCKISEESLRAIAVVTDSGIPL